MDYYELLYTVSIYALGFNLSYCIIIMSWSYSYLSSIYLSYLSINYHIFFSIYLFWNSGKENRDQQFDR